MILLYISVGAILGFILLGPLGMIAGIALALVFGVAVAAERKANDLEGRIKAMETDFSSSIADLRTTLKELEQGRNNNY